MATEEKVAHVEEIQEEDAAVEYTVTSGGQVEVDTGSLLRHLRATKQSSTEDWLKEILGDTVEFV